MSRTCASCDADSGSGFRDGIDDGVESPLVAIVAMEFSFVVNHRVGVWLAHE